jgi:hypothetical protein
MSDSTQPHDDDTTTGGGLDAGSGVEADGRSPLGQKGAFRDAEGAGVAAGDADDADDADDAAGHSERDGTESVPRAGGGPAPTDGTGTTGTGVTGSAAVS